MSVTTYFSKTVHKQSASMEISDSDSDDNKQASGNSKKAKSSKDHIRKYQENWAKDFFFLTIPDGSKPQCLISQEILQQHQKLNLSRHYETNHKNKYSSLYPVNSEARTLHIATLKTTNSENF